MKKNLYEISLTEYHYHANGRVTVYFKNQITRMARMKEYKNVRIAKREASKFHNRMARVYSNYSFD